MNHWVDSGIDLDGTVVLKLNRASLLRFDGASDTTWGPSMDSNEAGSTEVGSIVIGVAYLVLLAGIIWFCGVRASTFDEYSKYWGLFGTLVGVATGAIPSYFFKTQADKANDTAINASANAAKETQKVAAYAGAVTPEFNQNVRDSNRELFQ